MNTIHPLSAVSPEAVLGRDITIGPFCVVEPGVVIGDGCHLASHVVVRTGTHLGAHCLVHEGAVLGGVPQHLRAGQELGTLEIGTHNTIREYVTIHRGLTPQDATTLGDHNLIMVSVHIAHDCHVGNHVIMANNVMLAGHVTIGDRAYLSGAAGIHQFCRVGSFAMVGGQAHITQDIPPYVTVDGLSSLVVGLNVVGLRRGGFTAPDLEQLKAAYRVLYRSGLSWSETLAELRQRFATGPAAAWHEFLSKGVRGFVSERRTSRRATLRMPNRSELEAQPRRRAA